jgi:hypothetical protein
MNKAQAFFWLAAIVPLLQSGRPAQHRKVLIAAADLFGSGRDIY